jgi:hypothetical protein
VSDLFLAIIAISVLIMAVIQIAAIVLALRAARRVGELTNRLEQDIRPMLGSLQSIAADAAKATATATLQVERAEKLFAELSARIEQTVASVQDTVVGATRGGAWLAGLRNVLSMLRDLRQPSRGRRPSPVDEEDALFIG